MRNSVVRLTGLGLILVASTTGRAQVRLVADIRPGPSDSFPSGLTAFGGHLYFSANDGIHGRELWRSDGTTVSLVADLAPGAESSNAHPFAATGQRVYFSADIEGVNTIWSSDGAVLRRIADVEPYNPPGSDGTPRLASDDTYVFFRADDGVHGVEPWVATGDTAHMLADLRPGPEGSYAGDFHIAGGRAYFRGAAGATSGWTLWSTDGLIVAAVPGPDPMPQLRRGIGGFEGRYLFGAVTPEAGHEVWTADETGMHLLGDLRPGPEGTFRWYGGARTMNGRLFFFDGSDHSLWATDGETVELAEAFSSTAGQWGAWMLGQTDDALAVALCEWTLPPSGGVCHVLRGDGYTFEEVGQIETPDEGIWGMVPLADAGYFLADATGYGIEPWVMEGDGIRLVEDINPGPPRGMQGPFVHAGSQLFFVGLDPEHGLELWTIDPASTSIEELPSASDQLLIARVSPNPSNSMTTLDVVLRDEQALAMEVLDILGRRLLQHRVGQRSAGTHAIELDLAQLDSGTYVVRVLGTTGMATARIAVKPR